MMTSLLVAVVLVLAFANGANDNFKGVATLYGAGILSYRKAVLLGTVSTILGSLLSVVFATKLAVAFSAKGLIPDALLTPSLLVAVGLAAASTVLLATVLGLPISTTHALVGGLAGAGAMAASSSLDVSRLVTMFFTPLLLSPVLAVPVAGCLYATGRWARVRLGLGPQSCFCAGEELFLEGGGPAVPASRRLTLLVAESHECLRPGVGSFAGLEIRKLATALHVGSGTLVGLARGMNDTPKIVGLLAGASVLPALNGTLLVAGAMAMGGMLAAWRVARTLSVKVTTMNEGQGLAGNVGTSVLVTAASWLGLPVSTTHVSTGGIVGVGAAGGKLNWQTLTSILGAWLITAPLAAALGAVTMWCLQ